MIASTASKKFDGKTMKSSLVIIAFCLLALVIFIACEGEKDITAPPKIPSDENGIELVYTAEDTLEAQALACWFSGELLASDVVFSELLYNINYLRYVHGDSFSVLNENRFMAPWIIGELLIKFDDTTCTQIINREYTGWESLAEHLQPDTILRNPDTLGWGKLGFDEWYNPRRLAEIYVTLPGALNSTPNGIAWAGTHTFPIFPGWVNEEMSYLFVHNGGSAGGPFSYFKYINEEPQYIGTRHGFGEPEPDWWPEAQSIWFNFEIWDGP